MLTGLYQAAEGMKVRLAAQDVISNNLANAGTAGFQREITMIQAERIPDPRGAEQHDRAADLPLRLPLEHLNPYSVPDTHGGVLQRTGVGPDVALEGQGYLVVQTAGGLRLVRGGSLHANAQGQLVTLAGDPLLSTDGKPIEVAARPWKVAADGTVTVGGAIAGRMRIVRPTGPTRREGASLLSPGELQNVTDSSVAIRQGYLERANVEPVREMVDMIAGFRAYESAQRAVVAQDQTLGSLFDIVKQHA